MGAIEELGTALALDGVEMGLDIRGPTEHGAQAKIPVPLDR